MIIKDIFKQSNFFKIFNTKWNICSCYTNKKNIPDKHKLPINKEKGRQKH